MWLDDRTARLDRFSHIALKPTLGLQNYAVSLDLLFLMQLRLGQARGPSAAAMG